MSTLVFETGAVFKLQDEFSRTLIRLEEGLEGAERLITRLQAKMDKLKFTPSLASSMRAEFREAEAIAESGVMGIAAKLDGLGVSFGKAFAVIPEEMKGAIGKAIDLAEGMPAAIGDKVALGMDTAAAKMFSPVVEASRVAAERATANLAGISASVERASVASRAAGVGPLLPSSGRMRPHGQGVHMRGESFRIPGGHVGVSGGDGMVPALAGFGMLDLMKHATEGAMEFRHWEEMFKASNFSADEIQKAKGAAWSNAMANPNYSATDSLKSIFEMIKVFPKAGERGPSVDEAVDMLPTFSRVMVGLSAVKAENIHSRFAEGKQVYDLAKGLEETGVTQRGATPEIREANTQHMINELFKTMLSERGVTDGSSFYAMTNNAKGSAQNWDERMATVVAPILGSVMRHSKLGNADYMALKSYQGGHITSDAVDGLMKYHMVDQDDVWQDQKKQWHLKANSHFAEGMQSNVWDWSAGVLERMKKNGIDISNQDQVNKIINEIGSNGSTTNLMRALLEPATRSQIAKDMYARDQIKDSALGQIQAGDPGLKIEAAGKALSNFFAAFGEGAVDPAIKGLTGIAAGVNAIAAAAEAHPDIAKATAAGTVLGGAGLLGYGGGKMLGLWGGSDAGLGAAATQLDASAGLLKEAAIALGAGGHGAPSIPGASVPQAPGKPSPWSLFYPFALYESGRAAIDSIVPWIAGTTPEEHARAQAYNPWDHPILPSFVSPAAAPPVSGVTNFDGNALHKNDVNIFSMAGQKFGELTNQSGILKASFTTLDQGAAGLTGRFTGILNATGGVDGSLKTLSAAAIAAARALASVALTGGMVPGAAVAGRIGPIQASTGVPTVSGPPPRKVSPGAPASAGPLTTAMNVPPIHAHIYVGGKKIHHEIVKQFAQSGRFPTTGGGVDGHSHYSNAAGTPVTDAA